MAIVDEQGRVFGRWNAVDAAIAVVLLGLIPLAYGAYVLFRPPPMMLNSVEPASIQAGEETRLTVHGANLRPYLRVSFNSVQGRSFLFSDPTRAVVEVTAMPAGVYDVILYDHARERARITNGLTVLPRARPETQVDVAGFFTAVTDAEMKHLAPDTELGGLGRILRVGKPTSSGTRTAVGPGMVIELPSGNAINLPAVVRMACVLVQRGDGVTCEVGGRVVSQEAVIQGNTPTGGVFFQIDQVRSTDATEMVEARIRFTAERESLELLKTGDVDRIRANEFVSGAVVTSAGAPRPAGANLAVSISASAADLRAPAVFTGDMVSKEVVLRVPSQRTSAGWYYGDRALRAGTPFLFRTSSYELRGLVLTVTAAGNR